MMMTMMMSSSCKLSSCSPRSRYRNLGGLVSFADMMPPEDPCRVEMGGITRMGSPAKTSRSENVHVHADPDQADDDDHRKPTPEDVEKLGDHSVLRQPLHRVTLKFQDIVYKIKLNSNTAWWNINGICTTHDRKPVEKTILNGITGKVCPGEILAMLGPSGSGKTTLLSALGGRLHGKVSGSILFNGQRFGKSMKRKTGFVTQDDVLYAHLTVRETLIYAALLRLPRSLSRQEKAEQADSIISELGLSRCRNSIIGGPFLRGVSGGERKRVSIGHEMLTNPSLLLLDEPTSGLDSTTAQRIIFTLQSLAKRGRTIVTTIHQPSSRLYYMFHKVLLLSEGNPIYYGEASTAMDYFTSIGFPPSFPMNPADFMLDLANGIALDTKPAFPTLDQAESQSRMELEVQKTVRQTLVAAYNKNLASRLKEDNANNANGSDEAQRRIQRKERMDNELVAAVHSAPGKKFKREKIRVLWRIENISSSNSLNFSRSAVVAMQNFSYSRPGWLAIFLLNLLGIFPSLQCHIHISARALNADQRAIVRHVQTIFILHGKNGGRLANGVDSPHHICDNNILDGGPETGSGVVQPDVASDSVQRVGFPGPGFGSGSSINGREAGNDISLGNDAHIPASRRLLLGVQYDREERYECSTGGGSCRVADYPAIKDVGLGNHAVDLAALGIMLLGYRFLAYAALRRVKGAS
eukprot:Gb_27520 [translate_table: standard]